MASMIKTVLKKTNSYTLKLPLYTVRSSVPLSGTRVPKGPLSRDEAIWWCTALRAHDYPCWIAPVWTGVTTVVAIR